MSADSYSLSPLPYQFAARFGRLQRKGVREQLGKKKP